MTVRILAWATVIPASAGEKNDKWVLEDAGNGLYYVKNTVRNAYMEWYDSNGNWSAYYNIAEGSEGMFALAFYKVTDVPRGSESRMRLLR